MVGATGGPRVSCEDRRCLTPERGVRPSERPTLRKRSIEDSVQALLAASHYITYFGNRLGVPRLHRLPPVSPGLPARCVGELKETDA
jgi:hypothetical protein